MIAGADRPKAPTTHRWTVEEYFRADQAGIFEPQRVELIEGEIVDIPAQGDPHAWVVSRLASELCRIFCEPFWVKLRGTQIFGDFSAPDPDFVVMSGPPSPPAGDAPVPLLIVEVSESTLQYDRGRKASLYAANGIADYWIVDVAAKEVEILRGPARDGSQRYGWGYKQISTFTLQDRIVPLANPQASIEISQFLG